jgi:L-amino acid N-acyltransferase YncA
MNLRFEPMSSGHGSEVMDIFNYYIENGFSAYPDKTLPDEFFKKLIDMTRDYPAYTIFADDKVAGFCFIRAYNPFPTFKECAEISYFIHKDYTGKGIGKSALDKLETGAKKMGIKIILASISSENTQSISFHKKNGFRECGRFENVLKKKGKLMDVVWMQKDI